MLAWVMEGRAVHCVCLDCVGLLLLFFSFCVLQLCWLAAKRFSPSKRETEDAGSAP